MFDFPQNPPLNTQVTMPDGTVRVWDNTKWIAGAYAPPAFLPLSGGTMTGPLVLSGDPASAMQAATKQYVDAHASGISDAPNDAYSYMRHALAWQSGGALSGNLGIGITVPALQAAPNPTYGGGWLFAWGMTSQNLWDNAYFDGTNYRTQRANEGPSLYQFNAGSHTWMNGPNNVAADTIFTPTTLMMLDTSGNLNINGTSGIRYYGASNSFRFYWDGTWPVASVDNGGATCQLTYINSSPTFNNLVCSGNADIAGSVISRAGRVVSTNNNGNPSLAMWNQASGCACFFFDANGTIGIGDADGNGVPQNYRAGNIDNSNTWNLTRIGTSDSCAIGGWGINYSGIQGGNYFGCFADGTNGIYYMRLNGNGGTDATIGQWSDANLKKDIAPADYDCLASIRVIPLHQFRFKEAPPDTPITPIGFLAQEVAKAFPAGALQSMGGTWGINTNSMLAALVGAVQQLAAEVNQLKERTLH